MGQNRAGTLPRTGAGTRAMLASPGLLLFLLFFFVPLGFVLAEALAGGTHGIRTILASRPFWTGLLNSLVLGVLAAAISLGIGLAVALRLARMAERPRLAWQFLIALPLTFSGLIVAYGFILAFGRAGFVTLLLERFFGVDPVPFSQAVYSPYGLAFVYAYYLIPRVVMMLTPVLVNFDTAQLAAAESLGASRLRTLCDILLPQLKAPMISAFALVAAVAIGAYGTALALVGTQVNILPLQLFTMVSDAGSDFAVTATLGLVLAALCTLVMGLGEWAGKGR
ncbi:MAG: ABC transporter permease subunit [Beijerinckiaceae bacterium]|nr:ABC transporter permease subunit [Beijerinckiaceae bacterium]